MIASEAREQKTAAQWCERHSAHTLEIAYLVVFTLPQGISPWVELHSEVIHDQLLKSTWECTPSVPTPGAWTGSSALPWCCTPEAGRSPGICTSTAEHPGGP